MVYTQIECQYGHHMTSISNFSPSGLTKKFTICRACKAEEMRRYRNKHRKQYNEKHKLYLREWRTKRKNNNNNVPEY